MMGTAHTLRALALLVVVGAVHCSSLAPIPRGGSTCRPWQVTNADTHNGTYNMAFSEDGATMVIATANCSVQAYDTCSGSLLWSTPCPLDVCSQQYTCGASLVATTIAGGKTGAVLVSGAGVAQGFVDGVAVWKTGQNIGSMSAAYGTRTSNGDVLVRVSTGWHLVDAATGTPQPAFSIPNTDRCLNSRVPFIPRDAPPGSAGTMYMYTLCGQKGFYSCNSAAYVEARSQTTGRLVWNASTDGWPVASNCGATLQAYQPATTAHGPQLWSLTHDIVHATSPNSDVGVGCAWSANSHGVDKPTCWSRPVPTLNAILAVPGLPQVLVGALSHYENGNGTCDTFSQQLAVVATNGTVVRRGATISLLSCGVVQSINFHLFPGPGKAQVTGFYASVFTTLYFVADMTSGAIVKGYNYTATNAMEPSGCAIKRVIDSGVVVACDNFYANNLPSFLPFDDSRWHDGGFGSHASLS